LLTALLSFIAETVAWLAWLEYLAWIAEIPVIVFVFGLMASVMLAYACGALFFRPILDTTMHGGEKFTVLVESVGL
jgi:hypothetical protein